MTALSIATISLQSTKQDPAVVASSGSWNRNIGQIFDLVLILEEESDFLHDSCNFFFSNVS